MSEVGKAQWDRELRVQVRARASSSSCALGRAMLAPDQSTSRPFRGCAGRKFSSMGVEFFPSKCRAANWDSCKTQQLVNSALTTLAVVLPTQPLLPHSGFEPDGLVRALNLTGKAVARPQERSLGDGSFQPWQSRALPVSGSQMLCAAPGLAPPELLTHAAPAPATTSG